MVEKIKYEPKLLVLRIKLANIKPYILREVYVRNTISFQDLHDIIQIAMGWENEHLYEFRIDDIRIVDDIKEVFPSKRFQTIDAASTTIARFLNKTSDKIKYEYDFGDSWLHEISVTKVMTNDPKLYYPVCIKVARACPPEDCGGFYGYTRILDALNSKERDEDDESLLEWVGENYDPKFVDANGINSRLKKLKM